MSSAAGSRRRDHASDLREPVSERDHVLGPSDAPATLVEYGDFECPHCGRAYPLIRELRATFSDHLRFVFRHFPVTSVHPHADLAARAAEAAAAQGKFWPMHDRLFEHQDSLGAEMKTLGTRAYKAYYVIGTEKELRDKGVIAKEGGANLLFFRAGRTMVPSRVLNPDAFTAIDQREVKMIPIPDTTAKYRIVSRQSLDDADVLWRDAASFKGNLNITKPDEFWAPSKFLIIVKM